MVGHIDQSARKRSRTFWRAICRSGGCKRGACESMEMVEVDATSGEALALFDRFVVAQYNL